MLARAAVRNPSIFLELKGKKSISIPTVRREYNELCKKYPNHPKYKENMLKYLGTNIEITTG